MKSSADRRTKTAERLLEARERTEHAWLRTLILTKLRENHFGGNHPHANRKTRINYTS